MIEQTAAGTTVTGEHIQVFQMLALKGALKLEALGMKRRGQSAFSIVKSVTGLKAKTAKEMVPKFEAWIAENYPVS